MARQECKVCSTGSAAVVNQLLAQKVFVRDIGEKVGLSKSSIHRHSQKCFLREAAGTLKRKRGFDPTRNLLWAVFPAGKTKRMAKALCYRGELRDQPGPGDCRLIIKFAAPPTLDTAKNPDALTTNDQPKPI